MIHFYGSPNSSAGRTHWLLEELHIPYEYQRVSARDGQTRAPEFLAMNPSGSALIYQWSLWARRAYQMAAAG
jgi:glutathione S-transferase